MSIGPQMWQNKNSCHWKCAWKATPTVLQGGSDHSGSCVDVSELTGNTLCSGREAELPVVRERRNCLCDLLKVPRPQLVAKVRWECAPGVLCSWRCPWGCSQPAAEHVGWLELEPQALPGSFQGAFQAGSAAFQTQMCSHCSSALPGEREKTGTSPFQQQDDDMRCCADHRIAALPLWMNSRQNHKVCVCVYIF